MFEQHMKKMFDDINESLDFYLKKFCAVNTYAPIKYSVNAGGKRVRPILLLATFSAFENNYEDALVFASAIEFIHTYSLIHDDLPSMDNDDFRRGLPTCHKKFGEANAILAGDGLLNLAFEIMIDKIKNNFDFKYILAIDEIAKSSGTRGIIGGQVADLYYENKKISEKDLRYIHENKTAKLIIASIKVGAILAKVPNNVLESLEKIAYNLGIAFQIKDDILDIVGNEKILGKPILSDVKNQKNTYVSLYGLEKSKEDYFKFSNQVIFELENLDLQEKFIYNYIKNLINRQK